MNIKRQMTTVTPYRKSAIAAGVLFLITHVTSVGAVILYDPILNNASYMLSAGLDTQVILGTFLDVILALAVTGTAVALYPVVKRWNEGVARMTSRNVPRSRYHCRWCRLTSRRRDTAAFVGDCRRRPGEPCHAGQYPGDLLQLDLPARPWSGLRDEHGADGLPDVSFRSGAALHPHSGIGRWPPDLRLQHRQDVRPVSAYAGMDGLRRGADLRLGDYPCHLDDYQRFQGIGHRC